MFTKLKSPNFVIVKPFPEVSVSVDEFNVNNDVFAIAVNADVGGVKLTVYNAVPLTIRKFVI